MRPTQPSSGPSEGSDIAQMTYRYLVSTLLKHEPALRLKTNEGPGGLALDGITDITFEWGERDPETGLPQSIRVDRVGFTPFVIEITHDDNGEVGIIVNEVRIAPEKVPSKLGDMLHSLLETLYDAEKINPDHPLDRLPEAITDAMEETRVAAINRWLEQTRTEHAALLLGNWIKDHWPEPEVFKYDDKAGVLTFHVPAAVRNEDFPAKPESINAGLLWTKLEDIPALWQHLPVDASLIKSPAVTFQQSAPDQPFKVTVTLPVGVTLGSMTVNELRQGLKEKQLPGTTIMDEDDAHVSWPIKRSEAPINGVHFDRFEGPGTTVYARTHCGDSDENQDGWGVNLEHGRFAVADGVGGNTSGGIGAHLALLKAMEATPDGVIMDMNKHLGRTDQIIAHVVQAPSGTTLATAQVTERRPDGAVGLQLDHVGDTVPIVIDTVSKRIIYIGKPQMEIMKTEYEKGGRVFKHDEVDIIWERMQRTHPRKNIISNAIGNGYFGKAESVQLSPAQCPAGTVMVLVSDGAFQEATCIQEIVDLFTTLPFEEASCELMKRMQISVNGSRAIVLKRRDGVLEHAHKQKAYDNQTVMAVQFTKPEIDSDEAKSEE